MTTPEIEETEMKRSGHNAWDTQNEIEFLNRIGNSLDREVLISREELLRQYLETIPKRTHWGDIQRSVVTDHVHHLLRSES